MKTRIQRWLGDDRLIFIVVSLVFAVILYFARLGGDDLVNIRLTRDVPAAEIWSRAWEMYFTWASRVLINFVMYYLTGRNQVFFALFMGLSMYVLLSALSRLFVEGDRRSGNLIVAGVALLYPLTELGSAGWIATMTTYLSPIAFGMMSLVPIRRWLDGESICWYELIAYGACLIYGANNEQMMVVILFAYTGFLVYTVARKRSCAANVVFWLLSVACCVFIFASPGNRNRTYLETRWLPFFGKLSVFDKVEIGLSMTLQWLIVENHLLVVFLCAGMTYLIWKKFRSLAYSLIPFVPFAIVSAFHRQFSNLSERLVPFGNVIAAPISRYGLISETTRYSMNAFVKFFVFGLFLALFILSYFLVMNRRRDLVVMGVLLAAGFSTRLVIGFSPSVFQSGYRACSVLAFCLISAALAGIFSAFREGLIGEKERRVLNRAMPVFAFLSMAKFAYDVARIFK